MCGGVGTRMDTLAVEAPAVEAQQRPGRDHTRHTPVPSESKETHQNLRERLRLHILRQILFLPKHFGKLIHHKQVEIQENEILHL